MALIQYVEPINPGSIFSGMGSLIFALVLCYLFYRVAIKLIQYIDLNYNRSAKYEIIEEIYLDKLASKKGINLDQELIKKKMLRDPNQKSIKRRIEDQIFEDMFGKTEKK